MSIIRYTLISFDQIWHANISIFDFVTGWLDLGSCICFSFYLQKLFVIFAFILFIAIYFFSSKSKALIWVTRANYRLKWKKIFTCTTFSPFTFAYNHENSNFPPFLTNLRKKDSFLLLLRFEPGPPGWQSTMLASRPGSQDM